MDVTRAGGWRGQANSGSGSPVYQLCLVLLAKSGIRSALNSIAPWLMINVE